MKTRILVSAVLSAALSLFPLWAMAEEAAGSAPDPTAVAASTAPAPTPGQGAAAARGAPDAAADSGAREYVECFYVAATKDYTCRTMAEPSAPR